MMLERIIGSQVRAALFTTLFTHERKRIHLRELARLTGLSAPSLMREAKLLVGDGLLIEERDANRTLYSANVRSPLFVPLAGLVEKAADPIELLRAVFAESGVDVAFVYGSRAKGSARPDSDYDIFIVGDVGLRKVVSLLSPLKGKVGVEINPYVVTRAEFSKRRQADDHFLKDVLNGKKIFLKGGKDELGEMEG